MKTYLADIITKIQKFSQSLDDLTRLTNQHWVSITDIGETKKVYIFRQNKQLLIAEDGIVEKASWEYLGNQSLLIDTKSASYLLKHAFVDEHIIALKLDSTDSYVFFVNETKYDRELNNIQDVIRFLNDKYLRHDASTETIGSQEKRYIISNRLPTPNGWTESMLLSDNKTLINTTLRWRQYCDSHSEFYPLYTYQELLKRGISIPDKLWLELEEYAKIKGYIGFNSMIKDFFFDI